MEKEKPIDETLKSRAGNSQSAQAPHLGLAIGITDIVSELKAGRPPIYSGRE